jgi:hypothetical protein
MFRKIIYSIGIIAALVAAMSFTAPANTKLTIRFHNYIGDSPLVFDSVSYKNQLRQSYCVTMFKYYVGNFHIQRIFFNKPGGAGFYASNN